VIKLKIIKVFMTVETDFLCVGGGVCEGNDITAHARNHISASI